MDTRNLYEIWGLFQNSRSGVVGPSTGGAGGRQWLSRKVTEGVTPCSIICTGLGHIKKLKIGMLTVTP